MKLAKPRFDIGLSTNNIQPMLRFWQDEIGVPPDQVLKVRRGMEQHRHDLMGSVLKINHMSDLLPQTPASGYRELLIAREGVAEPRYLTDPDGNRVVLVPPGSFGVTQIGVRLEVPDADAVNRFYSDALGLPKGDGGAGFLAGESLVSIRQEADAPQDSPFEGAGWRYLTLQVFSVDSDHAFVVAHGGREAVAPVTLGKTARISMVKDPAGNWIELSQRASITGSLEPG
ncbi:MAG: VOC family protein [Micropepsaceae bacterium]